MNTEAKSENDEQDHINQPQNGTRQSSPQQCSKTYNKRLKLKNKQKNPQEKQALSQNVNSGKTVG